MKYHLISEKHKYPLCVKLLRLFVVYCHRLDALQCMDYAEDRGHRILFI